MNKKKYEEYKQILQNTVVPFPCSLQNQQLIYKKLNDWVLNNTPTKLFKFRACNDNNISAFYNQQIWFSTASKMNDDFDSLLFCNIKTLQEDFNAQFDSENNLKLFTYIKKGGDFPEAYKKLLGENFLKIAKQKILSFDERTMNSYSQNIKNYLKKSFEDQYPFISQVEQRVIKFCSFSESINSPLMWGHYANNSTGFALAYDFRNSAYNNCLNCPKLKVNCFSPKISQLYPVVYSDKMLDSTEYARYLMQDTIIRSFLVTLNLDPSYIENILSLITCNDIFMHSKILLHKSVEWKEEREWRMTIYYNSPSYATDQISNVTKKPCALYLGRRINHTNEMLLRNIAYKLHLPVYKMSIDKTSQKFKLKAIRQHNSKKDLLL